MTKMNSIYIESLGCPRNQVDSEFFAGIALQNDYQLTDDPTEADIILVNTCGFIASAKEESIEKILELSLIKKKKMVVTGCLVKRYGTELKKSLPEVDFFVELKDFPAFSALLSPVKTELKRTLLSPAPYAYLRISDGCNNNCSYCAIPGIRGGVISEPLPHLIEEAKQLAETGVRELIITAMDITQYGIEGDNTLVTLLRKLEDLNSFDMIRLLYLHPLNITNELLEYIRDSKSICHYLDVPIQHISNRILESMNRRMTRQDTENVIKRIRSIIPDIVLRTTLMVGYPGETEKEFQELKDFVAETRFNRLGVFSYSSEENTPAFNLPNRVHYRTAERRQREIMELQEQISYELLQGYVGKIMPVMIERTDSDLFEGRTQYDSPDIDGLVFIENGKGQVGDIVQVEITSSDIHDLNGIQI